MERGANTSAFNARLNQPYLQRHAKYRTLARDAAVLVCEGTGMLWPEGTGELSVPRGTYQEEVILQSTEPLKDLRKIFRYDSNHRSPFYQTVTTAFTNEFFKLSKKKDSGDALRGVGEFIMAYASPKTPAGATYGVEFTDITKLSKRVCILAQPPMKPRLLDYLDRVQLDQHPIRELPVPIEKNNDDDDGDAQHKQRVQLMQQLAENARGYTSSSSSSNGGRRPAESFSLTRFLNYKDVDQEHIDHILLAINRLRVRGRRDVELRIKDEPVTMDETHSVPVGVYRLIFDIKRF
jgi:hypothetical protein